jgi:ParB family chromosome partitioning protein
MDAERLDDLAQSIKSQGVLQPVIVRRVEDKFEIVAGERRVRASIQAGLERIPVIVSEMTDEDALEAALIENLQREDLNPLEEAEAYQRLIKEFFLTQESAAKRVGRSRVAVTNSLRLLKLPVEIRDYIKTGEISAGHARALLACKTIRLRDRLVSLILDRGISVREAEEWVRRSNTPKEKKSATSKDKGQSAFALDLQEKIMSAMGLRVKVKETGGGVGRVEIHFGNQDDLDRLLDRLGIKGD